MIVPEISAAVNPNPVPLSPMPCVCNVCISPIDTVCVSEIKNKQKCSKFVGATGPHLHVPLLSCRSSILCVDFGTVGFGVGFFFVKLWFYIKIL